MMENIRIIDAVPDDAPIIADAILSAVGEDIVNSLAGDHSVEDVHRLFENLARRDDTQYSYLNTRIALTEEGVKAGVCVSYNGGLLLELRKRFFIEARRILGWSISEEEINSLPGETSEEEFYLDTLATLPEYRGRGIGRALIEDAAQKAVKDKLPLGLLVSDHNPDARKLYDSLGFKQVGRRLFAGEEMSNLRLKTTQK